MESGASAGLPVTRIGRAYPDRVEVRGRDLCRDLMGRLSFSEYLYFLLTGEEPSEQQRFFLDLLLVAIAEHGLKRAQRRRVQVDEEMPEREENESEEPGARDHHRARLDTFHFYSVCFRSQLLL